MKNKNYTAPHLEQLRMEAEMPVICTSGGPSNIESLTASAGSLY